MRKLMAIVCFIFISSFCFAEESIIINLPEYNVTINGETIENNRRQYPILEHKGITYFPMTWFDSRYLGIETIWESNEGLCINKSNVTGSYHPNTGPIATSSFIARKPDFDVYINNELYTDTEYPCLVYNNVTYLPLTWKIAKESFGWDYNWDSKKGLSIDSSNPKLIEVSLPDYAVDNDIIFHDNHYYFVETVGDYNVIHSKEKGSEGINEIYRYEYSTSYGKNTLADFVLKDHHLWLSFHTGGATMGRDHLYKIEDNQLEETFTGYFDFAPYKDDYVKVFYSVPPGPNNLAIGKDNKPLGNEDITYGWHMIYDDKGGRSMSYGNSLKIIDDSLLVFGSNESKGYLNRLYKINLVTGSSTILIDKNISRIRYSEDMIYYQDSEDNKIYTCDYNGQNSKIFSDKIINEGSDWYIFSGQLFIFNQNDSWLYRLDSEIAKYEDIKTYHVQDDKILLIFEDDDYGCIILDMNGEILRITDQIKKVYNTDGTLFFLSDDDKLLKMEY